MPVRDEARPRARRSRRGAAAAPLCAVLLLTGCSTAGTAVAQSAPSSTDVATAGPADASPGQSPTGGSGDDLLAVAVPLPADVLPAGYSYVDHVPLPEGFSDVYGGPEGPTGPTLYLHTGFPTDDVDETWVGAAWDELPGFPASLQARHATETVDGQVWTIVDLDGPSSSVHVIGQGMADADLVGVAERLVGAD